jgi:hypothetical protein
MFGWKPRTACSIVYASGIVLSLGAEGCSAQATQVSLPAPTAVLAGRLSGAGFGPLPALRQSTVDPSSARRSLGKRSQHCCLFVTMSAGSTGSTAVLATKWPFAQIGSVDYPGQNPFSVAVSDTGTLYIGDLHDDTVYAYRNGWSKPPSETYPQAKYPWRLAVGHDGTLYVGESAPNGGAEVVVYREGSQTPARTLFGNSAGSGNPGVAVDGKNDVYITQGAKGSSEGNEVLLTEYSPGSVVGKSSILYIQGTGGGDIYYKGAANVDDRGNLLIGAIDSRACPGVFVFKPGRATPSKEISFACQQPGSVYGISLASDGTLYFSTGFASNYVFAFTYPGGRPQGTWEASNVIVGGVAVFGS